MNYIFTLFVLIICQLAYTQALLPKEPSPLNVKQIHSGHSLTDPLFHPHWPGQYVNLIGHINSLPAWQLFDAMVGKSTGPGSNLKYRWENPTGFGSPDARLNISNWELLSITERVPLYYEGGSMQQWYLDGIADQRKYLDSFVHNAWNNGNNGNGTPTLLWSTWVHVDNSSGPFRQMLDIQGVEWEKMQDYANINKPALAPQIYMIPGHKMMARLYDDIQLGIVPGITSISQFFSDNIHVNELGGYAVSMIHYACIFNQSPVGLPNNLLPGSPAGTPIPSPALANYLQTMIWNVVTQYPRTGISFALTLDETVDASYSSPNRNKNFVVYPNPTAHYLNISYRKSKASDQNLILIFDSFGKLIYSGTNQSIDVSSFSKGTYFIQVADQKARFVKY